VGTAAHHGHAQTSSYCLFDTDLPTTYTAQESRQGQRNFRTTGSQTHNQYPESSQSVKVLVYPAQNIDTKSAFAYQLAEHQKVVEAIGKLLA